MRFTILLWWAAMAGILPAADDVLARVDAHAGQFGEVSRQIWDFTELGFHETKSSALLQQQLRSNGFDVKAGLAGMSTAFTATFGSGTLAGVELFENPAEVAAARESFEKRLAGRKWTTRITPDSKPRLDYASKRRGAKVRT